MIKNGSNDEPERPIVESSSTTSSENIQKNYTEELSSMISFEEPESVDDNNFIRQPSPPPVLAEVHDLAPALCPEAREAECKIENPLPDESLRSESPLELHIVSLLYLSSLCYYSNVNTHTNIRGKNEFGVHRLLICCEGFILFYRLSYLTLDSC